MPFYWVNCFNMVEYDGPFNSADSARSDAVSTFNEIQDGVALSVAIVEFDGGGKPQYFESVAERGAKIDEILERGRAVDAGCIEGGRWRESKDLNPD